MDKNNELNEERRAFGLDRLFGSAPWMKANEKQRHKTKIFKSGNSLAVRIPAGTDLVAGMEMELVVEHGQPEICRKRGPFVRTPPVFNR